MADVPSIKQFVDIHTEASKLLADEKVKEAKDKYRQLLDMYHDIQNSSLEQFHKEIAYEHLTTLFAELKTTRERVRIPVNVILAAILIIGFSFAIFLKPEIAGLVSFEDEIVHPVNITFDQTSVESITLKDRPLSMMVNGQFEGDVKLFYKQGEKLELIFDSEKSVSVEGVFTHVCEETCYLNTQTNVVELFVQIAGEGSITVDKLIYKVARIDNSAPVWIGKIRTFTVPAGKTIAIDLSKYFEDSDGDPLVYLSTTDDDLDVLVQNEQITLSADPGSSGKRTLTFIASDLAEVTKVPVTIEIK